jgi:serine/threonine protein phosphatase PrpC
MFEPAIYIQQKQIFGYSPMLNMSRSIGDYDLKKLGVSATPFTAEYPKKENSILLVGSDGFWDSWTTKELCAELEDLENYKNIHEKSIKMNKFYFKDDADDNTLIMVFF